MTKEEVGNLKIGLYRVFWNNGSYSLAAIGLFYSGEKWIAPVNWSFDDRVSPINGGRETIGNWGVWEDIKRVELIEAWKPSNMEEAIPRLSIKSHVIKMDEDLGEITVSVKISRKG